MLIASYARNCRRAKQSHVNNRGYSPKFCYNSGIQKNILLLRENKKGLHVSF